MWVKHVAEPELNRHRRRSGPPYCENMSKPTGIIVASAIGFLAIFIIVVIVFPVFTHLPDASPDRDRLPKEALTPEEITVTVAPQTDGTLHVSQRLIFDASGNEDRSIRWYLAGEPIGRPTNDSDVQSYAVMPRASEVSARELSTGEESTKNDPTEVADLTVTRDGSDVEDLYDNVVYEFANPNPPGEKVMWTPGRHVVDIDYVLDDVYLNVEGRELFVLPLRFPAGTSEAVSIRTVSLESGGPIWCLPDNVDFAPDTECRGLEKQQLSADGPSFTWEEDETGSIGAIGFEAPDNMATDPIPVYEHRRS